MHQRKCDLASRQVALWLAPQHRRPKVIRVYRLFAVVCSNQSDAVFGGGSAARAHGLEGGTHNKPEWHCHLADEVRWKVQMRYALCICQPRVNCLMLPPSRQRQ